jgi:hypothetical protein
MKSLDLYKALLKELDKFESPTFTIGDFNYFANHGLSDYITQNYRDSDVIQKNVDDVRVLLEYGAVLANLSTVLNRADLPDRYRHVLHVEFTGQFSVAKDRYEASTDYIFYPKRRRSNKKGRDNAYDLPSLERCFYQITGDKLAIFVDSDFTISEIRIDYLMNPYSADSPNGDAIYLNPDTNSDYNQEANNTTLPFEDRVIYELIKVIRTKFLENIESRRYQSSLNQQIQTS